MIKNIVVLDKNGNKAGETYLKRAKGLVKSGRAEYVDEAVIRLVAPPSAANERTETKMDKININDVISRVDNLMSELNKQTANAYATLEKADSDPKIVMVGNIAQAHSEAVSKAIEFYKSILNGAHEGFESAGEQKAPKEIEPKEIEGQSGETAASPENVN